MSSGLHHKNAQVLGAQILAALQNQKHKPSSHRSAIVQAHEQVLHARVQNEIKRDQSLIKLADGGEMTLPKAERVLSQKETRRSFEPLRKLIEQSHAPFDEKNAILDERFNELLQNISLENEDETAFKESLDREKMTRVFETLSDAALVALDVLGGAKNIYGFSRALERSCEAGTFSNKSAKALTHTLRDNLGEELALATVNAPRALCGEVLVDERATFVCTAPTLRMNRFQDLLSGRCRALYRSLLQNAQAATLMGNACALGLSNAPLRKGVLDDKKAHEHARAMLAREILLTFYRAIFVAFESEEEASECFANKLGLRLFAPKEMAWPTERALTTSEDLERKVNETLEAADLYTHLRELFDEVFVLFKSVQEPLIESRSQIIEEERTIFEIFDAKAEEDEGTRLVALFWELL